MLVDDALAFAAAECCLRVHSVLPAMTHRPEVTVGKVSEQDHATWLVKGGQLLTLIRQDKYTLLFCHENGQLYYASPDASLAPSCPDNHAFLGQAVEDLVEGVPTMRILIFDLAYPAVEDPKKRGEILRSLSHVFPPSCHVQWAGKPSALRKFLKNGLPHEAEAVISLGGCMKITREVQGVPSAKRRKTEK